MKLPRISFSALKSRVLTWNKYLRIAATAAVVGIISLSVMFMAPPDHEQAVANRPETTDAGKVIQSDGNQVAPAATEPAADQPTQALGPLQTQNPVKSVATFATGPTHVPKPKYDTSTALPVATVNPLSTAPYPFFEFVMDNDAAVFSSDSITLPFQIIRHNNPATDAVASITSVHPQDGVSVRSVQMTGLNTGYFVLGLSNNDPKDFDVTLTVTSSNALSSVVVPFSIR